MKNTVINDGDEDKITRRLEQRRLELAGFCVAGLNRAGCDLTTHAIQLRELGFLLYKEMECTLASAGAAHDNEEEAI